MAQLEIIQGQHDSMAARMREQEEAHKKDINLLRGQRQAATAVTLEVNDDSGGKKGNTDAAAKAGMQHPQLAASSPPLSASTANSARRNLFPKLEFNSPQFTESEREDSMLRSVPTPELSAYFNGVGGQPFNTATAAASEAARQQEEDLRA